MFYISGISLSGKLNFSNKNSLWLSGLVKKRLWLTKSSHFFKIEARYRLHNARYNSQEFRRTTE